MTPLREDNKNNKENTLLKLDDILSIFSNWEVILKCHITLGDTIAERLKTWDDNQKIGEIFLEEVRGLIIALPKQQVFSTDNDCRQNLSNSTRTTSTTLTKPDLYWQSAARITSAFVSL